MRFLCVIVDFAVSLFEGLIAIPIIWIGETALFLVTFGRHKPRWDMYLGDGAGESVLLSEISFWVGVVTIFGVGAGLKWLFFFS